jgi:hypothetical protein
MTVNSYPLTVSLLRSYEARDSSIRQDVLAVIEAVEYGDTTVELAWSEFIGAEYPTKAAAERLLVKTVTQQQRIRW